MSRSFSLPFSGLMMDPSGMWVFFFFNFQLPFSSNSNQGANVRDNICSSYGNWTDRGWNLRIHGNVYKLPNISQDKVDDLANVFLVGTSVKDLSDSGKAQARNVTRSIFVVQQGDQNVTMDLVNDVAMNSNGGMAGAVDAVREKKNAEASDLGHRGDLHVVFFPEMRMHNK